MIAIVGRGNVGSHLFQALKDKTETYLVNPRTLENMPQNPDIILLCVSDNVIEEVAEKFSNSGAILAHTSGSVPMNVLKKYNKEFGVLYPLQTFTKGAQLNYSEIPVFIEGSDIKTTEEIKKIASIFSDNVREADSSSRRKLHLASVFASNFVNAMAEISKNLISDSDIDFSVLKPLMKQTIKKLDYLTPKEAQTGPAIRHDSRVIETHLKMLSDRPDLKNLYQLLTKIIQND